MSGLFGPPFFLLLMLRCKVCGRPLSRLFTDEPGSGYVWSTRGLVDPCGCGRELPDPAELSAEIARALATGPLPDLAEGIPVRAPVTIRY